MLDYLLQVHLDSFNMETSKDTIHLNSDHCQQITPSYLVLMAKSAFLVQMSHVNVFYLKPLKPSHRFSWFLSVTNHFCMYLPISEFYTSVWGLLTFLECLYFYWRLSTHSPLLPVPQPPSLSWDFSWNAPVWTTECHVWLYTVCPDIWFLKIHFSVNFKY